MIKIDKKSKIQIIILFILTVFVFIRPHGLFSPDTREQYSQAITGIYNDWHPPIMAYIWGWIIKIIPYKSILYYIHYIFFIIGVYLICKYIEKKSFILSIIFIITSYYFSQKEGTLFFIWKDTGMLSSYLLGIGLILNIEKIENKFYKIIIEILIILLIFYGTALRANAIFAAIPLLILLYYNVNKKLSLSIGYGVITWIILILLINMITYNILKAKKLYPIKYIFISDILNISFRKDIEIPIFLTTNEFSQNKFINKFKDQPNINQYVFEEFPIIKMERIEQTDNNQIEKNYILIKNYWKKLILENKILYVKFKLKFFIKLLRTIYLPVVLYNLIIQIFLLKIKKIDINMFLVYLSGIFYLCPYFLFNASYDFRYIAYSIIIETFTLFYVIYLNFKLIQKKLKTIYNIIKKIDLNFEKE